MAEFNTSRRDLLRAAVPIGAALAVGMPAGVAAAPVPAAAAGAMDILPDPGFALSPYLYMQFMEPLGTTDGSVEASWDHLAQRSEEHTSELQSLMRISYAVFCLKNKQKYTDTQNLH